MIRAAILSAVTAATLASLPPPARAIEKPVVLRYHIVITNKGGVMPLDTLDDCKTVKKFADDFLLGAVQIKCEVVK